MANTGQTFRAVGACVSLAATSVAGTIAQPAGSTALLISALSTDVYWTFDGSAPGKQNGVLIRTGVTAGFYQVGTGSSALNHTFATSSGATTVLVQPLG